MEANDGSIAKANDLQCVPIDDAHLREIYQSDQDMYPAPLTFAQLQSWRDACPQFSILFQIASSTTALGSIIVLPLQADHWRELLAGNLEETAVTADMLAIQSECGMQVGLHVFHVEKLRDARMEGGFAAFALETTVGRARQLGWKVMGCSALTASAAGQAVFRRLSFVPSLPTGYREFFLHDGAGGYERTCQFPGQQDDAGLLDGSRPVFSQSEMVVRYSRKEDEDD